MVVDRKREAEHLVQARRHVAEGAKRVERQRRLIAEFERDGHDATGARQLLATFLETQRLQEMDLLRIQAELDA